MYQISSWYYFLSKLFALIATRHFLKQLGADVLCSMISPLKEDPNQVYTASTRLHMDIFAHRRVGLKSLISTRPRGQGQLNPTHINQTLVERKRCDTGSCQCPNYVHLYFQNIPPLLLTKYRIFQMRCKWPLSSSLHFLEKPAKLFSALSLSSCLVCHHMN